MPAELKYSSMYNYCMDYRYRVYSSSVELNNASCSPNPLCIGKVVCIIVSHARWHSSAENADVLTVFHLELPIWNRSSS